MRNRVHALVVTVIAMEGCLAGGPQRTILRDDTATWAAQAGCDRTPGPPGCEYALTQPEREALEELLSKVVIRLPRASYERVSLR
ncbi:MAG TPA: hypothetical protein VLU43_02710, partial [Anaeromyxobacteraceae bacterium]|nr:hypothetical protein [Anaeromyxobacteraceae bacterium]